MTQSVSNAETLPDELIIEDPELTADDVDAAPVRVRTAAFLADGRASTFLLPETIGALVTRQNIQEAIVDISTEAGTAVARQLMEGGVAYRIFDTTPPQWDTGSRPLLEQIRTRSAGKVPLNPDDLTDIDANIVLIPAPATDAGAGIDASEGTITAVVVDQMQAASESCLLILPPESGLRRLDNGDYVRLTIRLAE